MVRYNAALQNAQSGVNMFNDAVSPQEAFEKIIVSQINKDDLIRINNYVSNTNESIEIQLALSILSKADKLINELELIS